MKTLKIFLPLLLVAFVVSTTSVNAQTIQRDLNGTFNEPIYVACADMYLIGTLTFHFAYHLNPKTGKITNMHCNVLHSDLQNPETGEKVIFLDTSSDNLGAFWDWMNNLNYYNGYEDIYDIPNGWLNAVMPATLPEEGSYIEMSWKLYSGGEKYRMSFMTQIHKNAKGEVTVDNSKVVVDCIE
jgi:hypothetical protein